jgi:FMN-dependent oxidoreductase (nitrilotriacetate monooxygenase family)
MHLGVVVLGTGNHMAGWRTEGAFTTHMELPAMQEIAHIAERGKFDLLFISDSMSMDPTDHPSFLCRFEPTTLITALAGCTTHVGLGATVSTSFSEPFNVARVFGSIDHISGGRAGWNVVTSSNPKAALNFNLDEHIEHEQRYARANEFVDVVRGLWDCWEDGAIVADKVTGRYVDAGKVRPLNHQGRFFKVRGPINMARCPQGHPVIIQAGGSPSGLELAARTADVVFSVVQELGPAKAAYADLKGRMAKYGRAPDELAVLPGVMAIIGDSDAEARAKLAKLQSWISPTNATTLVASRIGYDVSGHPLDGPVPAPPPALNSRTFASVLYEMARRENMTLRDLYNLTAAARGHWWCAVLRARSPTHWKSGSSSARPTDSTSCRRISRAASTISSILSCPNCSAAACSAASTRARPCATTWACPAWLLRWCMSTRPVPRNRRAD